MPGLYYEIELQHGRRYRLLSPMQNIVSPVGTSLFFGVEDNVEGFDLENFFLGVVGYEHRTSTWDGSSADGSIYMLLSAREPGKNLEVPTGSRAEADALGEYLKKYGWEVH